MESLEKDYLMEQIDKRKKANIKTFIGEGQQYHILSSS